MFTKRQPGYRGGYWGLSLSGNCCTRLIEGLDPEEVEALLEEDEEEDRDEDDEDEEE